MVLVVVVVVVVVIVVVVVLVAIVVVVVTWDFDMYQVNWHMCFGHSHFPVFCAVKQAKNPIVRKYYRKEEWKIAV